MGDQIKEDSKMPLLTCERIALGRNGKVVWISAQRPLWDSATNLTQKSTR